MPFSRGCEPLSMAACPEGVSDSRMPANAFVYSVPFRINARTWGMLGVEKYCGCAPSNTIRTMYFSVLGGAVDARATTRVGVAAAWTDAPGVAGPPSASY